MILWERQIDATLGGNYEENTAAQACSYDYCKFIAGIVQEARHKVDYQPQKW